MKDYEAEIDDETLREHAGFVAFTDVVKKLKLSGINPTLDVIFVRDSFSFIYIFH